MKCNYHVEQIIYNSQSNLHRISNKSPSVLMSLSPQAKVSIFSIFSIKNVIKVRFISGKYFLNGWKAILRNSYKNHSFFWEVRFRIVTCVVFVPKCHMLTTYAHLEMCAWWFWKLLSSGELWLNRRCILTCSIPLHTEFTGKYKI